MIPIQQSDWYKAFPIETAQEVVKIVRQVWDELAVESSDTFHPGRKEPDLTILLCEQIILVVKERTKLTGLWSYERPFGRVAAATAKGKKVVDRRRTDIQYFSDATQLNLIFEFKKISHTLTRRKAYTGVDGMLRFVTGTYSTGQPVAIMVGILTEQHSSCVPPLERYLRSAAMKATLFMTPHGNGELVLKPPVLFPGNTEFDTTHLRSTSKAPDHGYITMAHMMLGFPGLPEATSRASKRAALIEALDA